MIRWFHEIRRLLAQYRQARRDERAALGELMLKIRNSPDENGQCWDRHGTHPSQGSGQCYVIPHMHPKVRTVYDGPVAPTKWVVGMSKGDRDGRGFRHHKACPSLNCDRCVNGTAKRPARRAQRREGKRQTRKTVEE